MSKKVILTLHLIANILAQGAVIALIPTGDGTKWYQAAVAILGVIIAFYDTSAATSPAAN